MGVYFYLMATSDGRGVARRCKLPCDCKYQEMNYLTPTLLMSTCTIPLTFRRGDDPTFVYVVKRACQVACVYVTRKNGMDPGWSRCAVHFGTDNMRYVLRLPAVFNVSTVAPPPEKQDESAAV